MSLFLHSMSRSVHNYHDHQEENNHRSDHFHDHIHKKEAHPCTTNSLTVWRKSLLFNCNGFTVFGSDGNLQYRVDNYVERPDETVLMDGSGNPIFTVSRVKKHWLAKSWWHVYEGELNGEQCNNKTKKNLRPIFRTTNTENIVERKNVLAYIYCEMLDERTYCRRYAIEGSYTNRSCKMLDDSRRVFAEIKRKEAKQGVCFGLEVFDLIVNPGFESRFAMVFVVLLDRMFRR